MLSDLFLKMGIINTDLTGCGTLQLMINISCLPQMACSGLPASGSGRPKAQASRTPFPGHQHRESQNQKLLFPLLTGLHQFPGEGIVGSSETLSITTWERKVYLEGGASFISEVSLSLVCRPQLSPTLNIVDT